MFTVGQATFTSDNDQVVAAGRRLCEYETSVTSVLCMCCDDITENKNHKVFDKFSYSYIYIFIYTYILNKKI